eukprot:Gb_39655 [translate_table: standard]
MEPPVVDFGLLIPPARPFLNFEPDSFHNVDFTGFHDLEHFEKELQQAKDEISILKAQDQSRDGNSSPAQPIKLLSKSNQPPRRGCFSTTNVLSGCLTMEWNPYRQSQAKSKKRTQRVPLLLPLKLVLHGHAIRSAPIFLYKYLKDPSKHSLKQCLLFGHCRALAFRELNGWALSRARILAMSGYHLLFALVPVDTYKTSESRYWTNEERERFNKALKTFGNDFNAIAKFVGTRSSTQVRTHAQKYYAKMVRDYKRNGKPSSAAAKIPKVRSN